MLLRTLALSVLTLACAVQAQEKLTVVGNIGITTQFQQLERPLWEKRIPEATQGAISATIKPWNEMGLKGPEVMRLLKQGMFDVGTTQMGFMAGDAPIHDATDLAGLHTSLEAFRESTQRFRGELERHYEAEGARVLALTSFQAQMLYCRDPIKGLADLKGRKVRSSGASQADFLEYFGASGIAMAFGEVQQALSKGVIDCAVTGTLGGYKAKWFDGARHLYVLPLNYGAGVSAISLKSWARLTPAVQQALLAEGRKFEQDVFEQNKRENETGVACNTAGPCSEGPPAGMALVPIAAGDEALRRKALLEQVLPRWAKRCGTACARAWNETIGAPMNLVAR